MGDLPCCAESVRVELTSAYTLARFERVSHATWETLHCTNAEGSGVEPLSLSSSLARFQRVRYTKLPTFRSPRGIRILTTSLLKRVRLPFRHRAIRSSGQIRTDNQTILSRLALPLAHTAI